MGELLDPNVGAALIGAAGGPRFAALVLDVAHSLSGAEEVFAYRAAADGRPEPLLSSSALDGAPARAQVYAQRFYARDPARRSREALGPGRGFSERVAASEIDVSEYRAICFDRPRLVEKHCYGWRDETGALVLSFYRRHSEEEAPIGQLPSLANLVLALCVRGHSAPTAPLHERLEARVALRYPELPMRERQVCALTVAGKTSEQAAALLGIRPGTVLTYRQRAYRRLGFTSAQDFLETLID